MSRKHLEIEVTGHKSVQALLSRVSKAMDPTEIVDQASAVLFNRIKTRYLRQEAPDGSKWPVSKAALERKRKGRDGGTLFDTGSLYHSLRVYDRGGNTRAIAVDPTAKNTRTGSRVLDYALSHQHGRDGQVKRVFLGFSKDDRALVPSFIISRIQKAIDES